jgi:hypothetical protein
MGSPQMNMKAMVEGRTWFPVAALCSRKRMYLGIRNPQGVCTAKIGKASRAFSSNFAASVTVDSLDVPPVSSLFRPSRNCLNGIERKFCSSAEREISLPNARLF